MYHHHYKEQTHAELKPEPSEKTKNKYNINEREPNDIPLHFKSKLLTARRKTLNVAFLPLFWECNSPEHTNAH